MTFEEIKKAHIWEATSKGAEIYNLGWASDDYGLCSKTDKGILDTEWDPKTGKLTHEWAPPKEYKDESL